MQRHLSRSVITISVLISSDIGTPVTKLISRSFNHLILIATMYIIIKTIKWQSYLNGYSQSFTSFFFPKETTFKGIKANS